MAAIFVELKRHRKTLDDFQRYSLDYRLPSRIGKVGGGELAPGILRSATRVELLSLKKPQ